MIVEEYLSKCRDLVDQIEGQQTAIKEVATRFAKSIMGGGMVHLFGSGHSRMMVEEMWPRYGSFPGFNPITELSLTFHQLVVGANGQRQAMFLENVSGLAEQILRNFNLSSDQSALVVSSSGCNIVSIEIARIFQENGIYVAALISEKHSEASKSKHPDGIKLQEYANCVLDTGAPAGDAMVNIDGLVTPVCPGSTVGGCLLVNAIKAEVALQLTQAGQPPKVLTGGCIVGEEKAKELFNAAYDEHSDRLSKLYAKNMAGVGT